MTVPKELKEKWEALRSNGDAEKISDTAKAPHTVTPQAVRAAMRSGKMSDHMFKLVADFYEKKAAMIAQYI